MFESMETVSETNGRKKDSFSIEHISIVHLVGIGHSSSAGDIELK